MKHKAILSIVSMLFITMAGNGQEHFSFRRKITTKEGPGWHSILLPPEIYHHVKPDLDDLRLLSFTSFDTTEVPYILRDNLPTSTTTITDVKTINQGTKDGAFFVTLELPAAHDLNAVALEFLEENFFGTVAMEGSQNLRDWFLLKEDQRIFVVNKDGASYGNTTISFPTARYRFLRAKVVSDVPLTFVRAQTVLTSALPGRVIPIQMRWNEQFDNNTKLSTIDVTLDHYRPVFRLALAFESTGDYYRKISISALVDSVETEKGYHPVFVPVVDGYITSFEPAQFSFDVQLAKKLRIAIIHGDNEPIRVRTVSAWGPAIELVTKLDSLPVYLCYGNESARKPQYDVIHFTSSIPEATKEALVGDEERISKGNVVNSAPLLEHKTWLWVAIIAAILILGTLTVRMMRERQAAE